MYIYKTTNTINGKFYIGKSKREINESEDYYGSGLKLQRAIKKYGKENFTKEIIDTATTMELLDQKEIYWIKTLKSQDRNIGYNIADGGTGGNTGGMREETKLRKSIIGEDGMNEFQRQGQKAADIRKLNGTYISGAKKQSKTMKKITENGAQKGLITRFSVKENGKTGQEILIEKIKDCWNNKSEKELEEFKVMRSLSCKQQIKNETKETKEYRNKKASEASSDTVSAFHIITQEYKRIPTETYNNNELWVGMKWKGFYEIIFPDGKVKLLTKLPLVREYAEEIGVKEYWITRRQNKNKPFKHHRSCHKHLDGVIVIQHSLEEVKNFF